MTEAWVVVCDSASRQAWLRGDEMTGDIVPPDSVDELYLYDEELSIYIGSFEPVELPGNGDRAVRLAVEGRSTRQLSKEDLPEVPDSVSNTGAIPTSDARFLDKAFRFDGEEVTILDGGLLPGEVQASSEDDSTTDTEALVEGDEEPYTDQSRNLKTVIAEGIDVQNRDFSDTVLPDRQLIEGNTIRDCDLSDIEMAYATFDGVDLRGTSFRGAKLEHVTFRDCRLAGTDFTEAKLHHATFEQVSLTSCTFLGTNLDHADLTNLALERVDLSETYLNHAIFDGTHPERASFDRAEMEDISVDGTRFEHSSFVNADFKQTDNLAGAAFIDCNLSDADLPGTDLTSTEIQDTRFVDADLRGITLSGEMTYSGLDFSRAALDGATFDGTRLDEVRFSDTRLTEAQFRHAQLDGAVFDGAKADGAQFDAANLERSSFAQTNLSNANFEDAALYGSFLESSRIDDATQFDDVCIYLDQPEERPPGIDLDVAPYKRAVSIYRTLEAVHEANALSAASRGYHRRRRRAQRRIAHEEGRIWDEVINLASDKFVSYGLRFRRLLGWSVLSVFVAAFVYAAGGLLVHDELGRLSLDSADVSPVEVLLQSVLFSAASFTGLTLGEFTATDLGKWLSVIQAGLGVVVFALFIYIFTSRAAR